MCFRLYSIFLISTYYLLTDVEHSTNTGVFVPPARSLPQLQYEGFEPPGDQDELTLEAGGTYGLVCNDVSLG